MSIHQPSAAAAANSPRCPSPSPRAGAVRLGVWLSMLAIVTAALIYDYGWARPGVDAADQRVGEFVEARVGQDAKAGALVTPAEIHQAIGRRPTWVERHATDQYEIEYYCWWGRLPLLNLRRHFLAIVYVGDEPRRFSSHHKNSRPPREALPMPFLNKAPPLSPPIADTSDLPLKDRPHLRRPVAAAWIARGKLLAVANQHSGSVSIVDFSKQRVLEEISIGQRLADITSGPSGNWLIAVDEQQHELIFLQPDENSLRVVARQPVSPYPVSVAVAKSGEHVSVASLWSRKLTIFAVRDGDVAPGNIERVAEISLPFNPREHRFASAAAVLVNDAFANRCYQVNLRDRTSLVPAETIVERPDPALRRIRGTDLRAENRSGYERIVGGTVAISLGAAPAPTPEERGEELFYSRRLSAEKNCHDCHAFGHTNYQLADTLGDETTGTPKRIPTLLGTSLTYPWAWNGKVSELDDQVRQSLETTMHVRRVTPRQVIDITAFLHSLPAPPPLLPATTDPADQAQLSRGQSLFAGLGCGQCHLPQFTYTSPDAYDVGLTDERGMSRFNPPSLLGVGQGYSFFHDGRAQTLAEVFTAHGHQLGRALADDELADLLRFLRSL